MSKTRQYWTTQIHTHGNDVCMNCGNQLDFNDQVAIMASPEVVDVNAPDDVKGAAETFYFCMTCGTDIARLHELGMRSFLGILSGPSGDLDTVVQEGTDGEEDIH